MVVTISVLLAELSTKLRRKKCIHLIAYAFGVQVKTIAQIICSFVDKKENLVDKKDPI